MNILKKFLPVTLAFSMIFTAAASASEFPDMPDDWTTASLEKAVRNGLLSGFEDGTIRAGNNITRAQMAAIVVRSFGATEGADLARFTDISGHWAYDDFSKAVQMGAFNGDDNNHLNPNNPITFQECFKVVSSVFGIIANTEDQYEENDLTEQDLSPLDNFSDGAEVSEWAKPYVASIVGNGYWDGLDGKITPKAYITRAQFAVLMDNLVTTYINEPGEYSDLPEGNILIKCGDVVINGLNSTHSVIISDGAPETENGITFNDATLNARLVVRGGGQNTTFNGFLKDFAVLNPNLNINVNISNLHTVTGYFKYNSSSWTITMGG